MEIKAIEINNYKSIKHVKLHLFPNSDGSRTFGLIGINEAGKSSILNALAIKDKFVQVSKLDFNDVNKPIEVIYHYKAGRHEIEDMLKSSAFSEEAKAFLMSYEEIEFRHLVIVEIGNVNNVVGRIEFMELPMRGFENLNTMFLEYLKDKVIRTVFWRSEDKYLITQPINFSSFSKSPESVSIPLRNCFLLAGITDLSSYASRQSDSVAMEELENLLGYAVTNHVRNIWKDHPIEITFRISDNLINFHVKEESPGSRASLTSQRSDGFKQFISFILSISAQKMNEQLFNTIILLDEPEIHLHPQAQVDLLQELIEITKGMNNNYLLFATHSNYLIDKNNLKRYLKVTKEKATKVKRYERENVSYAKVNFDVFDIVTTDYHNELFGILQELSNKYSLDDMNDYFTSKAINNSEIKKLYSYAKLNKNKTTNAQSVILPIKIRNIIHHPENTNNTLDESELKKSIEMMLAVINELKLNS